MLEWTFFVGLLNRNVDQILCPKVKPSPEAVFKTSEGPLQMTKNNSKMVDSNQNGWLFLSFHVWILDFFCGSIRDRHHKNFMFLRHFCFKLGGASKTHQTFFLMRIILRLFKLLIQNGFVGIFFLFFLWPHCPNNAWSHLFSFFFID